MVWGKLGHATIGPRTFRHSSSALVAQLVEQRICNAKVACSIPAEGIIGPTNCWDPVFRTGLRAGITHPLEGNPEMLITVVAVVGCAFFPCDVIRGRDPALDVRFVPSRHARATACGPTSDAGSKSASPRRR